MIFRLSQKLATKIKVAPSTVLPLDSSPLADWSAYLFTAEPTQYVIVTNTVTLYSVVMYGRGITSGSQLVDRSLCALVEFMADDGQEFVYQRFIEPERNKVQFSKALNRSVTGSMNDLVYHARVRMIEQGFSPHEVSFRLNEVPMGALEYRFPREVFQELYDRD